MPVSTLIQGCSVFPGTPPYPRLLILTALLGGPAVADDLFIDTSDLPQVLTATRLKQSPAAVPGSMTVLDSELIRASGARDIPELLRLYPA